MHLSSAQNPNPDEFQQHVEAFRNAKAAIEADLDPKPTAALFHQLQDLRSAVESLDTLFDTLKTLDGRSALEGRLEVVENAIETAVELFRDRAFVFVDPEVKRYTGVDGVERDRYQVIRTWIEQLQDALTVLGEVDEPDDENE